MGRTVYTCISICTYRNVLFFSRGWGLLPGKCFVIFFTWTYNVHCFPLDIGTSRKCKGVVGIDITLCPCVQMTKRILFFDYFYFNRLSKTSNCCIVRVQKNWKRSGLRCRATSSRIARRCSHFGHKFLISQATWTHRLSPRVQSLFCFCSWIRTWGCFMKLVSTDNLSFIKKYSDNLDFVWLWTTGTDCCHGHSQWMTNLSVLTCFMKHAPRLIATFFYFWNVCQESIGKESLEVHYSYNNNIILFYDLHFCTLGRSLQV